MQTTKEYSLEIGGKTLTASFTDLADQADGSVLLRYGDTAVLATAVMSNARRDGMSYFPLTVDYEEKFYAAGQILGSRFMRREGRPSDEAVLSGRAVDRTIRPLFDHTMRNDVQVVITVLSIDEDDPDVLAINAASLALAVSDIPWRGPVAAVRLGKEKDKEGWTVNPTYAFRDGNGAEGDMLVCGKDGAVVMVEAGTNEMPEHTIAEGFERAVQELSALLEFQKNIVSEIGKQKREVGRQEPSPELVALFEEKVAPRVQEALFDGKPGKKGLSALHDEWHELAREAFPDEPSGNADALFEKSADDALHRGVLETQTRPDGRGLDKVRPLSAKAGGISPKLHGSGIFYRGGTHIFSALTLGGPQDSLIIEGMEVQVKKRFMHHYNFPPFSTGETGRIGGFNRRMIGHGALAEKALMPVIPPADTFPYTIRIVSEALASNGSTSMGSVCGSTLALMDAGVPITAPVAGIAVGLIVDEQNPSNYHLLTDIQGPEDHHGDMDFKVAGTKNGVTAIQMDIKVDGVSTAILTEALEQGKTARLEILGVIEGEIATPRTELNPNAPHIVVVNIKPSQIGAVIGSGGKTVNLIKDITGADIDIEDDGTVSITGKDTSAEQARELVEHITREYKPGERMTGEVVRIADFGAFVRIGSPTPLGSQYDTEGLVHISEIAPFRIGRVEDVLKVGEEIPVVVKEVDEQGKIGLSIKDADNDFAARKGVTPAPPSNNHHNGRGPRKPRTDSRGPKGSGRA